VDVWSLGVVLFEMLEIIPVWMCYKCVADHDNYHPKKAGALATKNKQFEKILAKQGDILQLAKRRVERADLFGKAAGQFLDLLGRMLARDPAQRISAGEILRHPFLE
jgi:serine/threonine protein kinase